MGLRSYFLSLCERILGIKTSKRKQARRRRRESYQRSARKASSQTETTASPTDASFTATSRHYGNKVVDAYRNKPLPALPPESTATEAVQPRRRNSDRKDMQPLTGMHRQDVREVSHIVHRAFDHLSYAISGLAALVIHGLDARPPTTVVDVVCSDDSRAVFGNWALTKGFRRHTSPAETLDEVDVFRLTTRAGAERAIRVRSLGDFASLRLQLLRDADGTACVLSLPAIADVLAQGYVRELVRAVSAAGQDAFARDMRWVLRWIAAYGTGEDALSPANAPHVAAGEFWLPFTLSFPDTVVLFQEAGLRPEWHGIPRVLPLKDSRPVRKSSCTPDNSSGVDDISRQRTGVPPTTDSGKKRRKCSSGRHGKKTRP